ncbi:MAG: hypothetical protein KDA85_22730, partial [Planctomycetaceae bacterium]|nr:hypothetical protein [Planctomycetaceae bacterium]
MINRASSLLNFSCGIAIGAALLLLASTAVAQPREAVVQAVQPFVERQELAGAVMLVANREEVLLEVAVGH